MVDVSARRLLVKDAVTPGDLANLGRSRQRDEAPVAHHGATHRHAGVRQPHAAHLARVRIDQGQQIDVFEGGGDAAVGGHRHAERHCGELDGGQHPAVLSDERELIAV